VNTHVTHRKEIHV